MILSKMDVDSYSKCSIVPKTKIKEQNQKQIKKKEVQNGWQKKMNVLLGWMESSLSGLNFDD